MSNTGYKETLTLKGLRWEARPWSGVSRKGVIVLSVWDNLNTEDSECRYDSAKNIDVLRTIPGDWVNTRKGRLYMDHCHELKQAEVLAEVFFVRGTRWSNARSEVTRCWIDPNRFLVRITKVDPSGLIEGEFIPWTTSQ